MAKYGTREIQDRALALLSTSTEGLRHAALVRAIADESPETPLTTINTQVAALPRDRPHLVVRPERGLFRLVDGAELTKAPPSTPKATAPSLAPAVESLVRLGFVAAGVWVLDGATLRPILHLHAERLPCLYAFAVKDEVRYVGKSRRTLGKRLANYTRPGPSQSTNVKVNAHIRANIEVGRIVAIYALVDWEPFEYNGLPVNVAAGIEDEIVARMHPAWNA